MSTASVAIMGNTNSNDLNKYICDNCGELYIGEECCGCDHVTEQHAIAAALQSLWRTPLAPAQTLLVQDEYGVCYGTAGKGHCFVVWPQYEEELDGMSLLEELFGTHQRTQLEVIGGPDGHAAYSTEHYAVTLRRFTIEGRAFSASVFQPITVH